MKLFVAIGFFRSYSIPAKINVKGLPRHRENMSIFPDRDNMGNLPKYVFTEGIWLQYRQNVEVFKVRDGIRDLWWDVAAIFWLL